MLRIHSLGAPVHFGAVGAAQKRAVRLSASQNGIAEQEGSGQDTRPLENGNGHLRSNGYTNGNRGLGSTNGQYKTTIFGRQGPDQITLQEQIGNDGGGPRFSSPLVVDRAKEKSPTELPILIYLPGIDGTGIAAFRQFPSLVEAFELNSFVVPTQDRTSFNGLVEIVKDYLEQEVQPRANGRPVYLLGESFGGVLALAVANACKGVVDRVVLVNPATSFKQSFWPLMGPLLPQVPEEVYGVVPFILAPVFGNPLQLLAHNLDFRGPIDGQAGKLLEGVLQLFGTLDFLGDVLQPDVVTWKLELVKQGVEHVDAILPKVQQRVLLVVGEGDWMLPSNDEGKRLPRILPRCSTKVLEGRSHAVLQEAGIDLVKIIKEEGFYVTERRLSCPPQNLNGSSINNFGEAGPVELPTEIEREKAAGFVNVIKRLSSPVFFSTKANGTVVHGLDGIPEGRPLLFVGNHQTFAPDSGVLVEELLREKQMLVRGLAHPFVTEVKSTGEDGQVDLGPMAPGGSRFIGRLLTTYGAVPVSGRNMHKLLSQGEAVLLYPGGAREAFKYRDEKYQVFWPGKSEFVRMAAKFGATIIPVASIGAEDSLTIMYDGKDMLNTPIVGDYVRKQQEKVPKARKGVSADVGLDDIFVQPVAAVGEPQRYYFLFQKPIQTSPSDYKDRERCQEIYKQIKTEVECGLSYLLENREKDPYKEFLPRVLYEYSWGGKRAPTFRP